MKKATLIIAVFAVFFISLSAVTDRPAAPAKGYKAPKLEVTNELTTIKLDALKGKYVLLNFWKSADADSRLRCNQYAATLSGDNRIEYIAVNLDSSEAMYHEIMERDGLDAKTQYHAGNSDAGHISSTFHLEDGMKSFLIDPEGTILAVNPAPTLLHERTDS